ncbi:MAG TPA: hypothetical protein VFI60_02095, partial [Candidatus Acidoferrum sp.]|nr:hypothetical protein [Candidatus Acidoferrum sp.]
ALSSSCLSLLELRVLDKSPNAPKWSLGHVFVVFGVNGNDAGLAIHAKDGGVSRTDRKCSGHIAPHAAGRFLPDSILIQRGSWRKIVISLNDRGQNV